MISRRSLLATLAALLAGATGLPRRRRPEPFVFCNPPSETHWTKSRVRINGRDIGYWADQSGNGRHLYRTRAGRGERA